MQSRHRTILFTAALAAAVILFSCTTNGTNSFEELEECGGSQSVDRSTTPENSDAAPYFCRTENNITDELNPSVIALLSAIPDQQEYRDLINFDDIANVARIHDILRPGRDGGKDDVREYAISLVRKNGGIIYPAFTGFSKHLLLQSPSSVASEDSPSELDIADVDILGMAGLASNWLPPRFSLAILSPGDFSDVQDADFEIVNRNSTNFALGVRNVAGSSDSQRATEAKEALSGHSASLRVDVDFVDAMRGLYGLGSVSGAISDTSRSSATVVGQISEGRGIDRQVVEAAVDSAPLLNPFRVAAVGGGVDGFDQRFTTIVLVHDNERLARENVELLIGRIKESRMAVTDWPKTFPIESEPREDGTLAWSEVIERAEFSLSGRITLVRLYGLINPHALVQLPAFLSQTPVPGTLLVY